MSAPRKSTPRGQMTRGNNSGPAVMMMPPHIRATFMPNPPLKQIPPLRNRRKHDISGIMEFLPRLQQEVETTKSNNKKNDSHSATASKETTSKAKRRALEQNAKLAPLIEEYQQEQRESSGDYQSMNCYNTLFVGRLAYEVTERKLLREMEGFGPVKDIKLVKDKDGKSKGYGFVEFEKEEDMKRAYRAADGMRIEGRAIVVDVERGHTVPTWLPRRLGGGLGGTRLGGPDKNVHYPGRFDPSRPEGHRPPPMDPQFHGGMGRGHGPPGYGGPGGGPHGVRGGGPPPGGYQPYGGVADNNYGSRGSPDGRSRGDSSGGDRRRRRSRSHDRSEHSRYAPRPRY